MGELGEGRPPDEGLNSRQMDVEEVKEGAEEEEEEEKENQEEQGV